MLLPLGGEAEATWPFGLRVVLYHLGVTAAVWGLTALAGTFFDSIANLAVQKCNVKAPVDTSIRGCCCSCLEKCCPAGPCTRVALGIPCAVVSVIAFGFVCALFLDLMSLWGCVLAIPAVITVFFWMLVVIISVASTLSWKSWRLCCAGMPAEECAAPVALVGQPQVVVGSLAKI